MDVAIEFEEVHKSFDKKPVLRGLSLCVPKGSVYAFLGNNGEGKSTAIRILLGLSKADRGSVSIFGEASGASQHRYKQDIGCLVDSPSAYANLNPVEFLEISRVIKGLPKVEVDRVLELVDLGKAKRVLISKFSLGMKQRLALAHALLGSPRLLVLDEPSNGLDPSGIQEIRNLIKSLPEQTGATVFVSSHQLDEVEKIATHLALLKNGVAQFSASLEEFRKISQTALIIETDDIQAASVLLHQMNCEVSVQNQTKLKITRWEGFESWQLNQAIVGAGLKLFSSSIERFSLEHWFEQQNRISGQMGASV